MVLPSITHDRYSAASNEGLQNGTQSSLPGEETLGWKSQDH